MATCGSPVYLLMTWVTRDFPLSRREVSTGNGLLKWKATPTWVLEEEGKSHHTVAGQIEVQSHRIRGAQNGGGTVKNLNFDTRPLYKSQLCKGVHLQALLSSNLLLFFLPLCRAEDRTCYLVCALQALYRRVSVTEVSPFITYPNYQN